MRAGSSALAVLVELALLATPAQAQWQAPIGIPSPTFGIVEVAPQAPSPWSVPTAGFYYVDATKSAATDASNPYGTPAIPRRTIPDSLPAGAVVELHGTYVTRHTSPRTIVAGGTSARPVFIRGASATAKPIIQASWELSGSYVILENLHFAPLDSTLTGELVMLAPLHHAALRHSDLHGNLNGGGLGVVSWSSALTQHVVVFDNSIHDNGDVKATYDQDVHGISVGARVSYLWVVDNRLYRNSGDGIQINAGTIAAQPTAHHIYVGRNTAFSNKQTGFWAKQAVDVIFSENVCYDHRPSNSSMGPCMGYQYATERAWFLYNDISDSDYGIAVMSDSDMGSGVDSAFVGNVIHNIHHSGSGYNPTTAWSSAGIMLAGGTYTSIVNNTIYDVDAGINAPVALGSLDVSNNIIGPVTVAAGSHLFAENPALVTHLSLHHNLFVGTPRLRVDGSQVVLTAAQLTALSSLSGSPGFVDATEGNFRLQPSSPVVDRGETHPVYAAFLQRYGISIALDADRTVRPSGGAIDLGAYEAVGCPVSMPGTPPDPPSALQVTVTGRSVELNWTAPASCNPASNFLLEAGSAPGLTDVGSMRTDADDTSLSASNVAKGTFYIRVRSANANGTSVASNEVIVVSGVPGPPGGLAGVVSGPYVFLAWKAPVAGLTPTDYLIEVGTEPGSTDVSATVSSSVTVFAGHAVAGTYFFRVRAISGTAKGAPSNEIVLVVE